MSSLDSGSGIVSGFIFSTDGSFSGSPLKMTITLLRGLTSGQVSLEEEYEDLPAVPRDHNVYSLRRIGEHDVVIEGLP